MNYKKLLIIITGVLSTFSSHATLHELNAVEHALYEQIRDHEIQRRAVMQLDPRLCQIARQHCESMDKNGFFAHTDPTTSKNANDRLKDSGFPTPSWYAAEQNFIENLALNAEDSPTEVVTAWFNSPSHKPHVFGQKNSDGTEFYLQQILVGVAYVKKTGARQGYYAFISSHPPEGNQAATWQIPAAFAGPNLSVAQKEISLSSLPAYGVCTIQIWDGDPSQRWETLGCAVADLNGKIELPANTSPSSYYRLRWYPAP